MFWKEPSQGLPKVISTFTVSDKNKEGCGGERSYSPFWVKQISDFLIVDFHIGHFDFESMRFIFFHRDSLK